MQFPIRTARRDSSLPPGRIAYDIRSSILLLHTFQTEGAFEELLSTGRIAPDPARAEPDFGSCAVTFEHGTKPARQDDGRVRWGARRLPDSVRT